MQHLDAITMAMKDADGVSAVARKKKSVRVTIGGETYDLFCRKVPTTDLCGELRNAFGDMFKRRKSRNSDKIKSVRRSEVYVRHSPSYSTKWIGTSSRGETDIRPALLLERARIGIVLVFHGEDLEVYGYSVSGTPAQRVLDENDPQWVLPLADRNLIDNLETCLSGWGVYGLELP